MSELKVCGIVFCALSLIIVFKGLKGEYSLFIRLAITIGITIFTLTLIQPILTYIENIASNNPLIYKYFPYLIKSICIAFIVQITANCCNDVGEGTLADGVTLFGKVQIVLISIPLITDLISLASKFN